MTAYEIITVILGILGLLISYTSLLIKLIAFLKQKDKHD